MSTSPVQRFQTSAVSILNSPAQIGVQLGGDREARLAAIVLKYADEHEGQARQMRRASEFALQQAGAAQVRQMRTQADHMETSAYFSAVGSITEGLMIGSAGAAGVGGASPGRQKMISAAGQVAGGLGRGVAGHYDKRAGHAGADATSAANSSRALERDLDAIDDSLDDARDLEDRVFDFLDQKNDTDEGTAQAIIYRG